MSNADGVIAKNVVGLHRETTTASEQVTQAIMGQPVRIERGDGDWLHVQTWDTYRGWIESRWVSRGISQPARLATVTSLFTDALRTPDPDREIWTKLVITTTLELVDAEDGLAHVRLPDGRDAWLVSKDMQAGPGVEEHLPLGPIGPELVRTAKRFLGVPYLWGGTSPFGLDCSGFVQLAYKINGVRLLRDAHMQAADTTAVHVEKADILPGDLVFFADGEDKAEITHVGMVVGDGAFIHAAGNGTGVTINKLDDQPYERDYCGARRTQ